MQMARRKRGPRRSREGGWRRLLLLAAGVAWYFPGAAFGAGAAAPGQAQVAALFDPAHPVSAKVLAAYGRGGAGPAMAAYRAYRKSLPEPKLHHLLGYSAPAPSVAKEMLRAGGPAPENARPSNEGGLRGLPYPKFRQLMTPLEVYQRDKQPRYLRYAVEAVVGWYKQNVGSELTDRFAWSTNPTGFDEPVMAYLVDAAARADEVSEAEMWVLLQMAAVHGRELRRPEKYEGDWNHGFQQVAGLLSITHTLPELRGFPEYHSYADTTARRILANSYSTEGVWLEHSPKYQLVLTRSLEADLREGLLDGPELRATLRRAQQSLAWMIHPRGYLAKFGDTERLVVTPRYFPPGIAASEPELLWVLTQGKQGRPPERNFWIAPVAGYAVYRSTWRPAPGKWHTASYLAITAGCHSRIHKHADELSFEWSELGRPLLVDASMYSYDEKDPQREYCRSTRAHNTLQIDEWDYTRPKQNYPLPSPSFSGHSEAAGVYALEAELVHYQNVVHRRTYVFAPGRWLLLVDQVASPDLHTYTQWLHFDPEVQVSQQGGQFVGRFPGSGKKLFVNQAVLSGAQTPVLVKGQKVPRLQGWSSPDRGTALPNWALGVRAQAKATTMVTLLSLSEQPVKLLSAPGEEGQPISLRWSQDGAERRFVLTEGGPTFALRVRGSEIAVTTPKGPLPTQHLRSLPPCRPPVGEGYAVPPLANPDVADRTFSAVNLPDPEQSYAREWVRRMDEVGVSREAEGGLVCRYRSTAGTTISNYAGVMFPVAAAGALRLEVTFAQPEQVRTVYVDGYDSRRRRQLRWVWRIKKPSEVPLAGRQTYVLVPGKDSGYLMAEEAKDPRAITDLCLTVSTAPGVEGEFTLHRAEVAE